MDSGEALEKIEKQLKETGNKKAAYYACLAWEMTVWDVLDFPSLIDMFVEAGNIHSDHKMTKTELLVHCCYHRIIPLVDVLIKNGYLTHRNRDQVVSCSYTYHDDSKILIEIILNAMNDYKWVKKKWKEWGGWHREVIAAWLFKKETEKKLKKKKK